MNNDEKHLDNAQCIIHNAQSIKHIESLLNLFMQGKTTIEQECELRQFFASTHEIPKEWEPYREMMAYFDDGMPIATESSPRRNIARPVWAVVAAAAVAAIVFMVDPNLKREVEPKVLTPPPGPMVIADVDTAKIHDTIAAPVVAVPKPIVAKAEKKAEIKAEASVNKQKVGKVSSPKTHLDAVEMEREQGEMELAQQELMADRFIIEQERQEILDEQYRGRTQAYQAQQAFNKENPQFIQVVFK